MEKSENLIRNNNGVKEILLWRLFTAIIWSVTSQIFILTVFLSLVNLNILHPILGLQAGLKSLFTWHTMFHLIPLGAITFAQGLICSKEYISGNPFLSTRFGIILNVLSLRNIFLCGLHIISGLLTSWLYLSLLNITLYNSMIKLCQNGNLKCLNESTLFIITSGLWVGFYYYVKEHLCGLKNIFFPVIEQNTFLQIKSTVFNLFSTSVINATIPVGYYLILYYIYGSGIRDYVLNFLYLNLEDEPIDSIQGLFKPGLILYSWLCSTLFLFTMSTMELLFKINLTRRLTFPITAVDRNELTLGEGICLGKLPIIQHLACLDLFKLAINDSPRRLSIFTVSQPGGHPYNWNSIATSTLCLIDDYTQSLKQADEIETHKIASPIFNKSYEPVIPSPSNHVQYEPTVYRLRNMRHSTYSENRETNIEIVAKKYPWVKFKNKLILFTNSIPGVNYLFGDLKDAKIKYILSQGQPVVWAVQGLSILSSKSFFEDNFGIVLKDLPAILTSLVRLAQAVEKVHKMMISKKSSRDNQYHSQMLMALKSAVKRSLYNICNTFGPYINDFPIPTEIKLYLMAFMIKKDE